MTRSVELKSKKSRAVHNVCYGIPHTIQHLKGESDIVGKLASNGEKIIEENLKGYEY